MLNTIELVWLNCIMNRADGEIEQIKNDKAKKWLAGTVNSEMLVVTHELCQKISI